MLKRKKNDHFFKKGDGERGIKVIEEGEERERERWGKAEKRKK